MSAIRPVVIGITGASGVCYGVRILERLGELEIESHLVVTQPGEALLRHEMGLTLDNVAAKATVTWDPNDYFASISSGSFLTAGMIVAPCSMRTLSAVACSRSSNLLERAADVTLKEKRPLLLLVRETPLHLGHLKLMVQAAEAGATIMPPLPAFYERPQSLDQIVDHTIARSLDLLGIEHEFLQRWTGDPSK